MLNPEYIFPILMHRLGTFSGYYFLKSYALPPETVNIYPTFRCNLRCRMCFEKYATFENEIGIKDWCRIISEIKRFKPRIHISGGEPFLYSEIIPLIEYIKKNHLFLHITTNGTYLKNFADEITRLKVNQIDISIDGPEEIHDKIRGVKGSFKEIIWGLEELRHCRKNRRLPQVKFNSIIDLENPLTMKEVIRVACEYKVDAVQFIFPLFLDEDSINEHRIFLKKVLNRDTNYWAGADRYQPVVNDPIMIYKRITELLGENKYLLVDIFPHFDIHQFKAYCNPIGRFDRINRGRCRAMWHTATILPDGSVESCPDYVVGNAFSMPFLKIWNNEAMADLRRRIRRNQFFSVCRACCFYYR